MISHGHTWSPSGPRIAEWGSMAFRRSMLGARMASALAVVVAIGAGRSALAQPRAATQPLAPLVAPPASQGESRWYGYQLMIPDAAVVMLMLVRRNDTSLAIGEFVFVIAPLVVHGVHRNNTMVIVSPLMRIALPLGGALIGVATEGLSGVLGGFGLGVAVALVVDYASAWEQVPAGAPPATAQPGQGQSSSVVSFTSAGIVPTVNGASLVLGGRF
jgi:hypothetical protein